MQNAKIDPASLVESLLDESFRALRKEKSNSKEFKFHDSNDKEVEIIKSIKIDRTLFGAQSMHFSFYSCFQ